MTTLSQQPSGKEPFIRRELWFGLILMAIIVLAVAIFMPWSDMKNGHLGLLMLALVVVAIMLGFPTAFTLMGMGVLFAFMAYFSRDPNNAVKFTLDLMVQRTWAVMTNDVLISIPLFVFMGYLVERANLIEKLFKSLHLAMARLPGSLAVATIFTCAVFATATGIVGAVVTLMGLLALPAMMKAGYDVRVSAGAITAGGCLGILIPPSVMLIVYGATAGVSVVKLYAGAFFPGLMLAGLYMLYVILLAKFKPHLMPPLKAEDRVVALPAPIEKLKNNFGQHAVKGLVSGLKGARNANVPMAVIQKNLFIALLPLMVGLASIWAVHRAVTAPDESTQGAGQLQEMGSMEAPGAAKESSSSAGGVQEPPSDSGGLKEPPSDGAKEANAPVAGGVAEPPGAEKPAAPAVEAKPQDAKPAAKAADKPAKAEERLPTPAGFWWFAGVVGALLAVFYALLSFVRLEIFKMLLSSFFPLAVLILFVLGTIVFGLATPTEAAAVGSFGGVILAAAYKQLNYSVIRDSVYLTAKTSAMVCWLFVGSSIFSAAFALLGGQELVEQWVLSLGLTKIQFLLLSQAIIFILGWPLEWTEIIVIFMPIFIPLLDKFGVDPLFFGLLVALNLQTAFLSPPVAMAAFYLKGVAPPHVTLNQIFAGMIPFMVIQIIALALLYIFPQIGLWLPEVLYK